MQGGIHLLSGLLLASLTKRKEFKLAAVFGAILPDIDIFVAGIAYVFTRKEATIRAIHRTFTHSLIFLIGLPLLIYLIGLIPAIKERYKYDTSGFALGLFLGMAIHVFLDMLYVDVVYLLWPSNIGVGFPIFPIESLNPDVYADMFKLKLIQTTDFFTDIFFFYIPMLYLAYKMDVHKKIRLPFLIYAIIDFITITVFFGLMYNYSITYVTHMEMLYIPGIFFLLISVFSPILFREVIREFKMELWEVIMVIALIAFSQILFFI